MSIEAALITAVSVLSGAVSAMALWFRAQFAAVVAKLDECETDRDALWERIISLTGGARPAKKAKGHE